MSLELIAPSGGAGNRVMVEICQKVLDVFRMPAELALSIVVPIFKGKGNIRNCCCHGAVKLLGHGMKVLESVLEKRLCIIVIIYNNNRNN